MSLGVALFMGLFAGNAGCAAWWVVQRDGAWAAWNAVGAALALCGFLMKVLHG